MKIDKKVLTQLASLSNIKFSPEGEREMLLDFNKMVHFIKTLEDIDTTDVAPLTHIHNQSNIFREDKVENMLLKSEILNLAPNSNSDYIKVPKVLGK